MRTIVLDPGPVFRDNYPDPILSPGESLIRVRMAGICGTDLESARGYMAYRGIPGHELSRQNHRNKCGVYALLEMWQR
jgi:threonine dehydrogenase-like Zn-dependent dehydrogenase